MQAAAAKGLVQELSAQSKAALRNNVKTQFAWQLAEKPPEPKPAVYGSGSNDKVKLTMFMESKCPGCRHFSTTTLKELLETPGMTDIVDFHAVTWGWAGTVVLLGARARTHATSTVCCPVTLSVQCGCVCLSACVRACVRLCVRVCVCARLGAQRCLSCSRRPA